MEITVVRHGQSESNRSGLWQGQGDSPLSEEGRLQAGALAYRLDGHHYDLVVSSDLQRAVHTAEALGYEPEIDPTWRELDIGTWEGRAQEDVAADDPDTLAAVRRGEDVKLGGGESLAEFDARVGAAFETLQARLDPDHRAMVVAHGGVIASLTRYVLGQARSFWSGFGPLENTSLTHFRVHDSGPMLISYNDATHLGPLNRWTQERHDDGNTLLTLIRHGQTDANIDDRWQGVTDGELTIDGRAQAAALADWYPGLDTLYTSPLQRAQDTAAALADVLGVQVEHHDGVIEMDLGEWEDLTTPRIQTEWAHLWEQIYDRGEDLPRGTTGESLTATAARMEAALQELAHRHAGAKVGVVSHGGAIRSYVLDLLDIGHAGRDRLAFVDNTAVTHILISEDSATIADYNVAPHLE
ncbi:MAG: histidine phosphatase family protein [Acidimicrobiia bacterium]|nr:histidine phosphatase family protein [Acidimicrobiia bacterium]